MMTLKEKIKLKKSQMLYDKKIELTSTISHCKLAFHLDNCEIKQ